MPKVIENRQKNRADIDDTYIVESAVLLDVDVDVGFEDSDEYKLFYGIAVGNPKQLTGKRYAFQAMARAGRHKEENPSGMTYIEATYGVLISTDIKGRDKLLRIAKHCAKHVLWGRFSTWYSTTASQIPVLLPPLPLIAEDVEYDEELNSADSEEKQSSDRSGVSGRT